MSELERAIENAKGSLEVLDTLREEFSEWLGEVNEEGQREALENVIGHLESMSREYMRRRHEAELQLDAQR
jgi:hypothetical protein